MDRKIEILSDKAWPFSDVDYISIGEVVTVPSETTWATTKDHPAVKVILIDRNGIERDISDRLVITGGSGTVWYSFAVGTGELMHLYPCPICNPKEYETRTSETFQLLWS